MTIDQAVAILRAERALPEGWVDRDDAWKDYVREASCIVARQCNAFTDLNNSSDSTHQADDCAFPECPTCTHPDNCDGCEHITVDVVFLRDPEDSNVFAVFPGEAATLGNSSHMVCYDPVGRHSCAGTTYCGLCKEVTNPSEYANLSIKLGNLGYNLRVVHKEYMFSAKYTDARASQIQTIGT